MKNNINIDPTPLDFQRRLEKWAEVTSLSLRLLEASLKKEFPDLSPGEIHNKMMKSLHTWRHINLPKR